MMIIIMAVNVLRLDESKTSIITDSGTVFATFENTYFNRHQIVGLTNNWATLVVLRDLVRKNIAHRRKKKKKKKYGYNMH